MRGLTIRWAGRLADPTTGQPSSGLAHLDGRTPVASVFSSVRAA